MKVTIDKNYERYRSFIENIPNGKLQPERIFCNKRNSVYILKADENEQWVVKKFKRPTLANCVIYTWFRKNKAERSFQYAYRLLKEGINTPYPIAYIAIAKHGLFHTGYYISQYLPCNNMSQADPTDATLKQAFIDYAKELYNKGIVNYDFNPNNVLISKDKSGNYQFSLVDINRIRFKETHWRKHVHAFLRCVSCLNMRDKGNKGNRIIFQINMMSRYCLACGFNLFQTAVEIHVYIRFKQFVNALHRQLKRAIHPFISKNKDNICY